MENLSSFSRYCRQIQIEEFGNEGQQKLQNSTVALVGCGGLGTVISNYLVRAGVGKIIIIDPDIVELDNLQRQVLFDEEDVHRKLPKADACVKLNIPWIYGGVVATYGASFTIIPSETPCLRCFIDELPSPGDIPKCEEVGVLGSAVSMIASIEVTEGLKFLIGKKEALLGKLINVDVWSGSWELFELEKRNSCPACGQRRFEFLTEEHL